VLAACTCRVGRCEPPRHQGRAKALARVAAQCGIQQPWRVFSIVCRALKMLAEEERSRHMFGSRVLPAPARAAILVIIQSG
jgi:hypothetical protein